MNEQQASTASLPQQSPATAAAVPVAGEAQKASNLPRESESEAMAVLGYN